MPVGAQQVCPGAEEVASLGPATNDQRQDFDITGESFRVTYDVEFTNEQAFRDFTVEIEDRFGLVESDSTSESGTRSFTVPEGAGSYDLLVEVEPNGGAEYTVVIEDCTGTNNNGGGGGNGNAGEQYTGQYEDGGQQQQQQQTIINIPQKPLPNTSGPALLIPAGGLLIGLGLTVWRVTRHRE